MIPCCRLVSRLRECIEKHIVNRCGVQRLKAGVIISQGISADEQNRSTLPKKDDPIIFNYIGAAAVTRDGEAFTAMDVHVAAGVF